MFRITLLVILIFFSNNAFAEYKWQKELSASNSFYDEKDIPYSSDLITDKENTLLLIWNHGSGPDTKMDKCKKKPKFGYTWEGAVLPVILEFHNKKINNLVIKIFRLCSGVKGMSGKEQDKIFDLIKQGKKIDTYSELKQQKRQNIIFNEVEKFIEDGFNNIVIGGYSAGGWASLNLISRFPDKFKGAIAFNPAFAGPKQEWNKELPHWGFFREEQINELQKTDTLNALVFVHSNDEFETPETLSFLNNFNDINLIDYTELKATECIWADLDETMPVEAGHAIPQSSCFTNWEKKNNFIIDYLNNLYN